MLSNQCCTINAIVSLVLRLLFRCVQLQTIVLILDPAVYYAHLAGNRAKVRDPLYTFDDAATNISTGSGGDITIAPLEPIHQTLNGGLMSMWFV
jgi:hypothetical protein